MALKYWFEFTDVKAIVHKVEIFNDDFVGDSIQIYGSCALTKAATKDTLESIRGGGLQIDLEATTLLSFNDLYSENEREYSVKYTRNGTDLLFYGWVSPEGLIESFVNDKWIISLDCTDGLGFLTNLSYVENATGLQFVGKQSGLEIISNCLKRTNLQQNIYSSIDIYYTGMSTTENVLANTYFNANRFVKDDNEETYMNCDEVLRSVIEIFGACITQYKGDWYIYKPNELFDNSELTFFAYDYAGAALATPTVTIDFAQGLGSQINNFYPHHVNKNQQLTIDSAIGAYRINYKYGVVKSYLSNNTLISVSDTDIPDFTILDGGYLSFPPEREGVYIDIEPSLHDVLKVTDDLSLSAGDSFKIKAKASSPNGVYSWISMMVKLTTSTSTYYLEEGELIDMRGYYSVRNAVWVSQSTYMRIYTSSGSPNTSFSTEYLADVLPDSGTVEFKFMTAHDPFNSSVGTVFLSEFNLTPTPNDTGIEGENHTFQITDKPSSKIKDIKKVFNGDNPSDIYIGTIYKSDEDTPTSTWNRNDTRQVAILRIMGEEQMKMYGKPLRVFSGDVYGYIDYMSVISIDGINNTLFMPIEYQYDAQTNITKLKLKQILNNLLPDNTYSGIDYELTYDYGNVVEPTIVG